MFAIKWMYPAQPQITPEERIETARKQLVREAASLDFVLSSHDRQIKDSAQRARAALDRGDVEKATDFNERQVRLRHTRRTIAGQQRSLDLAQMQLPVAKSHLVLQRSLQSVNDALTGAQQATRLESMQALGERHQALLREQALTRRELDNSQDAAMGDIDQEVREEAEAMTRQMLAECTARLQDLPDGAAARSVAAGVLPTPAP